MTAPVPAGVPEGSPYPGIEPFSYARRAVFFAREKETRTLSRLIVMYRGVLLFAASGTGKSSLLNAGLIPQAIQEGYQPERIRVQLKKGEEIVVERISMEVEGRAPFLPSRFAPAGTPERVVLSVEKFVEVLHGQKTGHPLLIFDQFEEWVTLFEEGLTKSKVEELRSTQERIKEAIASLINDGTLPVKVLLSFRDDYLAKLETLFDLCPKLPDRYLQLTPLKGDQIYRVIRGPFEDHPGQHTPELTDSLAKRIQAEFEGRSGGADVRLTEVQIVCQSLFESEEGDPEELFEKEGGVRGILERYLERALETLAVEQREPAIGLLSKMVTAAGTRNIITRDDLLMRAAEEDEFSQDLLSETLDHLERKTKLVRRERRREVYFYEISSEFLVEWIQKKTRERQVDADQRKLRAAEEQAWDERRRAARLRRMSVALGIVSCVLLLILGYALLQRSSAKEQARRTLIHSLIEGARENPENHELSLLLAYNAVSMSQEGDRTNQRAQVVLSRSLLALPQRQQLTLNSQKGDVGGVAFDVEGKLLAAGGKTVRVWQTENGKQISDFSPCSDVVNAVSFSPDGIRLAAACFDGTVQIWTVHAPKPVQSLSGDKSPVKWVAFTPDGARLASGHDNGALRIWDSRSGKLLRELVHDHVPVIAAAISPSGTRLASLRTDDTVRIWDLSTGKPSRGLDRPVEFASLRGAPIATVVFSSEEVLAAASLRSIGRWDVSTNKELSPLTPKDARTGRDASDVALSPDAKRLAVVYRSGEVKAWDLASERELLAPAGHSDKAFRVVLSPDGHQVATASLDGVTRVWRLLSSEALPMSLDKEERIVGIASDTRRRLLFTTGPAGPVKVWDSASRRHLFSLSEKSDSVNRVTLSQDGTRLATAGKTARVWDAGTGRMLFNLADHASEVIDIAFSPDGSLLATRELLGNARVWDVATGKLMYAFPDSPGETIAFSFDAKRLATYGRGGEVTIRELASGKVSSRLLSRERPRPLDPKQDPPHGARGAGGEDRYVWVARLAFSPDGRHAAAISIDGKTNVWDADFSKQSLFLPDHNQPVAALLFSPDGSRLATISTDGVAKVWNPSSGQALFDFSYLKEKVRWVAFTPDSSQLIMARDGGEVRTASLKIEGLKLEARKHITRWFTPEECTQYFQEPGCPEKPSWLNRRD
jgi:WD40 repeat protein